MSADGRGCRYAAIEFCAKITVVALTLALGACLSDDLESGDGGVLGRAADSDILRVPIFVASTRRGDSGAGADGDAHFSLVFVAVPHSHRVGVIERASLGGNDARRYFILLSRRNLDKLEFSGEIAAHVSGRVGASRDVLLYVHGYDTSLDEARFRLAQIVTDAGFSGVSVLFTWDSNSRSGLVAYESDKESATAARDALEKVILSLSHVPGVGRVHILAHSMGAWLAMESLRATAISGHPDLDGRLGEVMLAAPDIDLSVFSQQVSRLGAQHVSIFVSNNDHALSLSSRIAGDRPRLGAMDPSNAKDKEQLEELGVLVHDISQWKTDFVGHNTFAEAPTVVRQIGAQLALTPATEDSVQAVIDFSNGQAASGRGTDSRSGGASENQLSGS